VAHFSVEKPAQFRVETNNTPLRGFTTRWEMLQTITMHLAGAAAEELVLGHRSEWSAGSIDSDFAKATVLAIQMLTEQGFGKSLYFLPNSVDLTKPADLWKELELRDEVSEILREQYQHAKDILDGLRRSVVVLAEALVKEKRLDVDQIEKHLPTGPKKRSGSRPH
jgi:cell division protease FtsH